VQHIPKIIEFLGSIPSIGQPESFSEKIFHYRRLKGLSQENLARYLGVDPGTLANWEKGKREPSKRLKEKLNTILLFSTPNLGESKYY
jgi:transcriptional regulator with XRE-family HTH domain